MPRGVLGFCAEFAEGWPCGRGSSLVLYVKYQDFRQVFPEDIPSNTAQLIKHNLLVNTRRCLSAYQIIQKS